MGTDFWIVLQWWGMLFLVGAVAFPLTKRLFDGGHGKRWIPDQVGNDRKIGWFDDGYLFSKAVGMAVITWIVYVLGTLHLMPFSVMSIGVSLSVVFLVGAGLLILHRGNKGNKGDTGRAKIIILMIFEELFFFLALLLWSWIKGHEPSIHGLEKFMDYGFMKSILNSSYFPPADMWYAGLPINYYYFGHMVVAVLTKLSGLDLAYTFNLMLASIFAFTLTMSFSIGYQISQIGQIRLIGKVCAGLLTAFLVTLAGNMQTLYAFTKGYTGDDVKPFWTLLWKIGEIGGIGEIWGKLGEGMNRYWYANATRFIPFTIHEFPSYSFVVSDVHGHVLSLPFVLLAIALLIMMSLRGAQAKAEGDVAIPNKRLLRHMNGLAMTNIVFYGFLVGVLLMTNALDGPIYLMLFLALLVTANLKSQISNLKWKHILFTGLLVVVVAVVTSLPFLFHFKSFVTGVALNCPPAFLADTKIGPLLFESVEKCQHSPLWMMALLWGFFVYCGGWLVMKVKSQKSKVKSRDQTSGIERLLIIFFFFSLALIIFPEFFYFKDIYPAHFRSNTMFKLGYQAFVLFSIVSGYTIAQSIFSSDFSRITNYGLRITRKMKIIFFIFLLPQLFLVSIFPIFSVRSYFDSLRNYKGLNGLTWFEEQYPDDYEGIKWLNKYVANVTREQGSPSIQKDLGAIMTGVPVIIEADGDSYTDHARFSAFTGLPTIIGWPVHEWLWRGSYDVVSPRREVVRKIYESEDIEETKDLLKQYNVSYVIVGTLERQKYQNLNEDKLQLLGQIVFQQGETTIYKVAN